MVWRKKDHQLQIDRFVEAETKRRANLTSADFCPNLLLSFPRSGNHLVRKVLEDGLGYATLGAGDGEWLPEPTSLHDPPIHVRGFVGHPVDETVIAVKRHKLSGKDRRFFKNLIYLERAPSEAILSHGRDLADDEFVQHAIDSVVHVVGLRLQFASWEPEAKLMLRYEEFSQPEFDWSPVMEWIVARDPRLDVQRVPVHWFEDVESLPDLSTRASRIRTVASGTYASKFPERNDLVAVLLHRLAGLINNVPK